MGLLRWLTQSDAPGSGAGSYVLAVLFAGVAVLGACGRRRR